MSNKKHRYIEYIKSLIMHPVEFDASSVVNVSDIYHPYLSKMFFDVLYFADHVEV